jgi:flagellar motility protein MotE (MotC chaperone)
MESGAGFVGTGPLDGIMADDDISAKSISFNPALLKTIFDWAWKCVLILWAVFSFYSNQDKLLQSLAETKTKIVTLETTINVLNRELMEERSDIQSLKTQLQDDRDFYMQTRKR